MKDIFCEGSIIDNLGSNDEFLPHRVSALSYGADTIKYKEQRVWVKLLQHIKNTQSIDEFKALIKILNGADCACTLLRVFVP